MNVQLDSLSLGQTVAQAVETARESLRAIASDPDFQSKMALAFGPDRWDAAGVLAQAWVAGDFSALPGIEIRPEAEINGASGAFAGAANTIYISREFLSQNVANIEAVAGVLLEEIGHAVDWQLNASDAPGDEGAIFSALVRGETLGEYALQLLKAEDDTATVTLDGQVVEIEQSDGVRIEWIEQLGTPGKDYSKSVAADSSGNIYIGGYTEGSIGGSNLGGADAWVGKYDSQGNQIWVRQLGTSGDEETECLAVDSSGNVYITGYTYGSLEGSNAGTKDAWVAKYDSQGNQMWVQQLGTFYEDSSGSVGVDSSGNVYITGSTGGFLEENYAGELDAWVAKYDSGGNQLWLQQFGTFGDDESIEAKVDSSGNVYLAGYTEGSLEGSNAGNWDAWVAKYDSGGNQVWLQQLGSFYSDATNGVAVDSSGNVYVAGYTYGSLEGSNAGDLDAWVAKYDSLGNQLWVQQFGTSGEDNIFEAAVDSSDNLYITGYTDGSLLEGSNAGLYDAWAAKYDPQGNQEWFRQFGSSSNERSYFVGADSSGNVYITGETEGTLGTSNAGNYDAWVAKLSEPPADSAGNTLSSARNTGTLSGSLSFSDFVGDADTEDYYSFSLNAASQIGVTLDGLSADADLRLIQDANGNGVVDSGEIIVSSVEALSTPEAINVDSLPAGTYFVKVERYRGDTDYTLTLTAGGTSSGGSDERNYATYEFLAKDTAYKDWQVGEDVGNGYKVDRVFEDNVEDNEGFYAVGLTSNAGNPPVLAIRGTEPTSDNFADIAADLIPEGIGSNQFENNREAVEAWLSSQNRPDITGHSLGGALAQLFAADFTSKGGLLGEIVTFNAPGIDRDLAGQFVPANAENVTHNIVSGDLVTLGGEAFIAGASQAFSYADLQAYVTNGTFNKHLNPVLAEKVGYDKPADSSNGLGKPGNVNLPENVSLFWLNSPLFTYLDSEFFTFIAGATVATRTIPFLKPLKDIPPSLIFRSTVEATRKEIGENIFPIADALVLGGPLPKIPLPEIEFSLLDLLDVKATDLEMEYISDPEQIFKIQGQVSVPTLYNVTADFTGDNFIEISERGLDVVGSLSVEKIRIVPKVWEVRKAEIAFDTIEEEIEGNGSVLIPTGIVINGEVEFENGQFNSLALEADKLNKPIGTTGAFLQRISGKVDNVAESDTDPIEFGGGVGVTAGAKITLSLPSWAGGDFSGSVAEFDVDGSINSERIEGNGTVTVLGGLAQGTGHAELNWNQKFLTGSANYSILNGFITSESSFKANSNFDITMQGTAGLQFPDIDIPGDNDLLQEAYNYYLKGKGLQGNFVLQYINDGSTSNDFIWGGTTVALPFNREFKQGLRVGLNGEVTFTEPPEIPETNSFIIDAGTEWFVMGATWDNPADNVRVQVKAPDGTIFTEDSFPADKIAIVEDITNSTAKAVMVLNPDPGVWDINVVDSTGLGEVDYSAFRDSEAPTLEVTAPAADVNGPEVTISYNAFDADSDAKVSLFYDTDSQGFDGILIAGDLAEMDGAGSFVWNTEGIATGDYYVYAMVMDDNNAPVFSYSPGQVRVTQEADLSVTQTASAESVSQGDSLTYTVTVTNNGSIESKGVTLVETLPENVTFVSSTLTPSQQSGNTLTFDLGNLANSESATLDITVTATTVGTLSSSATVSSNTFDPDATNDVDIADTTVTDGETSELTSVGLSLEEGETRIIASIVLEVEDVNSTPAEITYTLSEIPESGTLFLNETALAVNGTFTQDDIDSDRLTYSHDGSETSSDSFSFSVAGKAGAQLASSTFDFTISPVNDAPVVATNGGLTLDRGATGTIANTVLKVEDADTSAGEIVYTLTALPSNGTLNLNGTALAVNGTFTQADIDSNRLTYSHNGGETTSDSISFTVSDGAGGELPMAAFNFTISPTDDTQTPPGDTGTTTPPGDTGTTTPPGDTGTVTPVIPPANTGTVTPVIPPADTGTDTSEGTDGNDTLTGTAGEDTLTGGLGDDILIGLSGNDSLSGNDGSDLIFGNQGDDLLDGGAGNDSLAGGKDSDTLTGSAGSDLMLGNLGADSLSGGEGNDSLNGNQDADAVDGGAGNDMIAGGKDSDTLTGGAGNDFLSGDLGNDRLIGCIAAASAGAGEIDTLTGGAGADTFVLGSGSVLYYNDGNNATAGLSDYAVIADFNAGEDAIELGGAAADCRLIASPEGLPAGTAIFHTGAGENELIAIVQGADSLNLDASYFTFL